MGEGSLEDLSALIRVGTIPPGDHPGWRALLERSHAITRGGQTSDDVQDALLKLIQALGRGTVRAETPLQLVAWLRSTMKHQAIDRARRARESSLSDLAEPAAPEVRDGGAFDAWVDRIESRLVTSIAEPAVTATTARVQARAAFYRLVLGLDRDEVIARLARPEPPSIAQLDKWVERGRERVAVALEPWLTSDDETECRVAGAAIAAVRDRRRDRGHPRIERRKPLP